jgi:hypothetical protein
MTTRTRFGEHEADRRRANEDCDTVRARMSSGVLASVPVHCLLSSLPPNCHRSHPQDAKTRPHGQPNRDGPAVSFLETHASGSIPRASHVCIASYSRKSESSVV